MLQFVFEQHVEFLCDTVFLDSPSAQCDRSGCSQVLTCTYFLFWRGVARTSAPMRLIMMARQNRCTETIEIVWRTTAIKGSFYRLWRTGFLFLTGRRGAEFFAGIFVVNMHTLTSHAVFRVGTAIPWHVGRLEILVVCGWSALVGRQKKRLAQPEWQAREATYQEL